MSLSSEVHQSLRANEGEIQSLLSKLDTRANSFARSDNPRREHARMAYRVPNVLIAITHPGQTTGRYLVTTRNLSAGGMAFLHGGFLHDRTTCAIILTEANGKRVGLLGHVRSCRLLTRGIHEIGVQFREKINPMKFVPPGTSVTSDDAALITSRLPNLDGRALIVSADEEVRKEEVSRLSATRLTPVAVDCIGSAADGIARTPYDLVLLDLDNVDQPPAEAVQTLRKAGFKGAIICVHAPGMPLDKIEKGVITLPRPVATNALMLAIGEAFPDQKQDDREPIFSTLGDTAMAASIEEFVTTAHSSVELITAALDQDDSEAVLDLCRPLRIGAGQNGFAPLAEAARVAIETLESDAIEAARPCVRNLTDLCTRTRTAEASNSQAA